MSHDILSIVWFGILSVLLIGYAILDGFDLGVGILHPIAKADKDRRIFMNSIGPLWDGNEVWLVTFGGGLFAAFPIAYATVFSGFYLPFMALLSALIFRAVSLEFRSKVHSTAWRRLWDTCFFAGSLLAALLFGIAAGHSMQGIPMDRDLRVNIPILQLFRLYPVLVGFLTVALFAMHGSIFLYLKTEGELRQQIEHWIWRCFGFFLILFFIVTMMTLTQIPHATAIFQDHPALWIVPVLNVLAIANVPRAVMQKRPGYAFVSSCAVIAALAFLFATAMYPNLVISSTNPAWSVTIFNARSSEATLVIMLTIALIGMPFVLAYTAAIYWVFRGKTRLDEQSY